MGDDSSPRKVLNKNIGYGKLYKIKNEIGYSWVCNDVHVITHYNEISKILLDTPLNELKYSKKWNGYLKNIKLKKSIVEFQENKTEINPYLLGLWLGYNLKNNIKQFLFVDFRLTRKIIEKLLELKDNSFFVLNKTSVCLNKKYEKGFYSDDFQKCIIFNIDKNKKNIHLSIPDKYLINSIENRKKILAGIFDVYYNKKNRTSKLTIISKRKIVNLKFLCESLGFIYKEKKIFSFRNNIFWKIDINGNTSILPLVYKRKQKTNYNNLFSFKIKENIISQGLYFGFTLNGNGRFLLGDFTITHNTSTIVDAVKLLPKDKSIMFLAFNKHIQEELKTKLPEYVRCYTTYGLGTSAIKRKYGDKIQFDEFKIDKIIQSKSKNWKLNDEFDDNDDISLYLNNIKKMVNLCRLTLTTNSEFIPNIAEKYNIPIKENKDIKRILKILEESTIDRKNYDFIDMIYLPAIDSSIWMFPQDYIFIDEVQDLNRCQIKIVEKLIKKDKTTGKYIGRLISVGDYYQCQPKGTKILMNDNTEKDIENLNVGDLIISYDRKSNSFIKSKINNIGCRYYNGNLIKIISRGCESKYTPEHKCLVKIKKTKQLQFVLCLFELMDETQHIRIFTIRNEIDFFKIFKNKSDVNKIWILKSYYSLYYAYKDANYYLANKDKIFNDFNKNSNYPIWNSNWNMDYNQNFLEIYAINIIPDLMQICSLNANLHNIQKIYELKYEKYSGLVYSLEIDKYETYVADNILTHNCIYGFNAADEKAFEWFSKFPNTKTLPLSTSFRCSKNVIKKAQEIVPDIKALPNAPDGIVRDGNVLKEAESGDFVLCRTTIPLIKLFFEFLEQEKKAIVKGSDIGVQLIELIGDIKSIDNLILFWDRELIKYRKELKKEGILNPNEHSGYVTLEDKVTTLLFLAKLSNSIVDLKNKIGLIFSDEIQGICLSTIHKIKGLEANRVFIIRPDLLPMKTTKNWEFLQEKNLEYVAYTRAKNELIFDRNWTDIS